MLYVTPENMLTPNLCVCVCVCVFRVVRCAELTLLHQPAPTQAPAAVARPSDAAPDSAPAAAVAETNVASAASADTIKSDKSNGADSNAKDVATLKSSASAPSVRRHDTESDSEEAMKQEEPPEVPAAMAMPLNQAIDSSYEWLAFVCIPVAVILAFLVYRSKPRANTKVN